MRSEALLDSAVFQLTPTRTRCDLVIIVNGKTEKLASGLLNPFVSHLKTAQDQIAKGGYSIKLEPDPGSQAAWFTKGTVERFVRFVSTPEVLERVNTIESEILQIEEAISCQGNDNNGLNSVEEQIKSIGNSEGNMQMPGPDTENAIVLYKTESHPIQPVSNESKVHEENSKVQLVRVLESRQKVLQKEQAMVFARTAAAGFDMESLVHLMLFAESFGASRLREACSRFMQLWEEKHESGQWIEVEATEAFSYRSEFTPLNSSGIIFEDAVKQKEFNESWPASGRDLGMETSGNATSLDNDRDRRLSSEPQVPHGHSVYQGQFQYPPFPQWPMHSRPSPYFLQPYPMHAMPYYQNYPADGQFVHPPYPPMEDSKLNTLQHKVNKQHSKHSKDGSSHSDDGTAQNTSEYEEEPLKVRRSRQKASRSGKKKGIVVIRNLNYIAAKRHETSGSKSDSSDTEIEDIKDTFFDHGGREHMSLGSLKRDDNHQEITGFSNVHGKDENLYIQEADAGNWQAFQSFLRETEEKMASVVDGDTFAGEKEHTVKKAQNKNGLDPIRLSTRGSGNYQEESIMGYDAFSGNGSRTKEVVSTDEFLTEDRVHLNCQDYDQFKEIDVGVGGYQKIITDDFIMYGLEKQTPNKVSSDPLVDAEHENGNKCEKISSQNVADESFLVPFRSGTQYQLGVDTRFAIDMDSEFLSASQKEEEFSSMATSRVCYEPDDLTLILEHTRENESVGYNQTVDFDIQVPLIVKQDFRKDEDEVLVSTNEAFIKADEVKLKFPQGELDKKIKDTSMKKTTSMRPTPLREAQKRADKLRNYKSDLQKLKKKHEEQEISKLEALKRERQIRIASRNGSKALQSPLNQQPSNADKSSKFKDSGIGLNVPLQKLPRSGSAQSNVSSNDIKTTTSNKLSQVALSLSELKGSEKKVGNSVPTRISRLSEPIGSRVPSSPGNSTSTNQVIKKAIVEEARLKKIPALVQLDKRNSGTQPAQQITADRTSSEVLQNKQYTKQQTMAGGRISMISEGHCVEMNPEKNPKLNHIGEYPLIAKTVAIFENQVVPGHLAQTSEGWIDAVVKPPRDAKGESATIDTGSAAIHSFPSPINRVEREIQTQGSQNDPINSFEKLLDPAVTDKPYQAPFARASSLEAAATDNLKYAEPYVLNSEMTMISTETIRAPTYKVSELRCVHQMYETQEKPQNQKDLRKLWKFGKKGHNSHLGDGNPHSYESVVDDDIVVTSNDFSRPFSILSPFRGRSNERKAFWLQHDELTGGDSALEHD